MTAGAHSVGPTIPRSIVNKQMHHFDESFNGVRDKLVAKHGEPIARDVLKMTRSELELILPKTPLFEGRFNLFNQIIQLNARMVALYRAMKKHDQTAEDVVRIYYELFDEMHGKLPGPARWGARQFVFGPVFIRVAQYSSKLVAKHPAGWDIRFTRGNGHDADFGFECTRCGVIDFYERNNAMELAPYCNFFDYIQSKTIGLGMHNPKSLGRGDSTCLELMKRGRETPLPENLKAIVH